MTVSSSISRSAALAVFLAVAGGPPAVVATDDSVESQPGAGQAPAPITAPTGTSIDVVVLDRDGRFVEGLRPTDFTVTVDGRARPILSMRRVSRGPGSLTDAASRQASGDEGSRFAAEPVRNVLVVVDQSTLVRGSERVVAQTAGALLDRLGIDDRIAVLPIPATAATLLSLTPERPPAREALAGVKGQMLPGRAASPFGLAAQDARATDVEGAHETPAQPDQPTGGERPAPAPGIETGRLPTDAGAAVSRSGLGALRGVMGALASIPGRKVVALFSAGVVSPNLAEVADAIGKAVSARVVIHAFGLHSDQDDPGLAPDLGPIETIARSTGGTFVMLGRNPERMVERTLVEISACYVLDLDAGPAQAGGRPLSLRVETSRKGLTVRSAGQLVRTPDPGDQAPEVPADAPAVPAPTAESAPARRPANPAREAELRLAVARLIDYATAYERQYSLLVAEEDFRQADQFTSSRLRSDFLLVRPVDEWMSFRDVFEVDGKPVRDRDERLRRLFLDPSPAASVRRQAIVDENMRYNLGPVTRTINVPFFPLSILRAENRTRFDFALDGQDEEEGVKVWRVAYSEHARPTLVSDLDGRDVPISGWFLVDQLTGAVVETAVKGSRGPSKGEIIVRYRRDPVLGMWVPARMRESYGDGRTVVMRGQATYSNFRRFQVKTEEQVTLPKE